MPRFVLSEEAISNLQDIHDDIAAVDAGAARRVLEDLRTAMHRLADHPGLGISARTSQTRRCGCGPSTPLW